VIICNTDFDLLVWRGNLCYACLSVVIKDRQLMCCARFSNVKPLLHWNKVIRRALQVPPCCRISLRPDPWSCWPVGQSWSGGACNRAPSACSPGIGARCDGSPGVLALGWDAPTPRVRAAASETLNDTRLDQRVGTTVSPDFLTDARLLCTAPDVVFWQACRVQTRGMTRPTRFLALFGCARFLARTHPEKRISHAWSTKWSLFAKSF